LAFSVLLIAWDRFSLLADDGECGECRIDELDELEDDSELDLIDMWLVEGSGGGGTLGGPLPPGTGIVDAPAGRRDADNDCALLILSFVIGVLKPNSSRPRTTWRKFVGPEISFLAICLLEIDEFEVFFGWFEELSSPEVLREETFKFWRLIGGRSVVMNDLPSLGPMC